ncbi:MAG: HxlR family transcriptional regulator [Clostridiaceae bacterium]|jgi:DNA-binding HxlR family transcriptional regulator|nr:HxlR family transcriptional regulator [Clostridiaceae bacterium]
MKNDIKKCKNVEVEKLYDIKCPINYAIDIIGQKWKLPIIWFLSEHETLRYNELKRKVSGITNTMLIKCLKELEDSKLLTRIQYNTIPPKVEYSLTESGKALFPALNELYAWGEQQMKIDLESKDSTKK